MDEGASTFAGAGLGRALACGVGAAAAALRLPHRVEYHALSLAAGAVDSVAVTAGSGSRTK